MKFKELFTESTLNDTERKMEMYKAIQKKLKIKANFYGEEFEETDSFTMEDSDGNKFKIYVNTTDFNKPVYSFEWL